MPHVSGHHVHHELAALTEERWGGGVTSLASGNVFYVSPSFSHSHFQTGRASKVRLMRSQAFLRAEALLRVEEAFERRQAFDDLTRETVAKLASLRSRR